VPFRLRERATQFTMRVAGKVLEDPKRAEAIAGFFDRFQRAKAAFDERQRQALRAAGLITRDDFKTAGKRLSDLKRRCAELADDVDRLLAPRE
jgi:hypothetical protein